FLLLPDGLLPDVRAQRCFAGARFLSSAGPSPRCFSRSVSRSEAARQLYPTAPKAPKFWLRGTDSVSDSRPVAAAVAQPVASLPLIPGHLLNCRHQARFSLNLPASA